MLEHLGSSSNPIDVDALYSYFEPISARTHRREEELAPQRSFTVPKLSQHTYTVYTADAKPITFAPRFHFDIYHQRFHQLMQRAMLLYKNGKPPHVANPEDSVFKHFAPEDWIKLSEEQQQVEMSKKTIVLTKTEPREQLSFDEHGLTEVAGMMSRQISITDQSIEPVKGCTPHTISGRLKDMWDNRDDDKKILNALDIPFPRGNRDPQTHTTDIYAWDLTAGHHSIDHSTSYPTEHMRWSLIGHKNSLTFVHIDCDGLSTEVTVVDGGKIWALIRERPSNPLSSTDFFTDKGFRLDQVLSNSNYDIELIALQPGDKLLMRPSQPHFVYGYANTICRGGHYYLTRTLHLSLRGMIHAFVLHRFLTNTSHPVMPLLRRTVLLFHMRLLEDIGLPSHPVSTHIPDVNTMDGLHNLVCACIMVILGNVLDLRTYQVPNEETSTSSDRRKLLLDYDVNAIPFFERKSICYARGVALRLLNWIRQCTKITKKSGEAVPDICSFFFVQITATLLDYKKKADSAHLDTTSDITLHLLQNQVHNILNIDHDLMKTWYNRSTLGIPFDSLELSGWDQYLVHWEHDTQFNSLPTSPATYFLDLGMTAFDKLFFAVQGKRQAVESELIALLKGDTSAHRNGKKRKFT